MILVSGLAAISNPVVGVGIVDKALLPGIGLLISKYGIRPAGQKLSGMQLEKEIKGAELSVAKEFEMSEILKVINPILAELFFALSSTEVGCDPLLDQNLAIGSISELAHERWRILTEKAICHVYKEVFLDKAQHSAAKLGPEDILWLQLSMTLVLSKLKLVFQARLHNVVCVQGCSSVSKLCIYLLYHIRSSTLDLSKYVSQFSI